MIPQFPQFKKLELSDRDEIETITEQFPPYSDFNFTSMWCWDTDGTIEVSRLNDNLVVHFLDYLTGSPFYSFIGTNRVTETAQLLIQYSHHVGFGDMLKLVPEITIQHLDPELLVIQEDLDHFDYLYTIEKLCHYDGNHLRAKRNFSNRFKKKYTAEVLNIDCADDKVQQQIKKLFDTWVVNKKFNPAEAKNEHDALQRFLSLPKSDRIITTGVFLDGNLIAFSPNELINGFYALMHFEKADEVYVGIYAYLMEENARLLANNSVKYLNFEQDLGLPGLRQSKKSFHPMHFFKKYRVFGLSTGQIGKHSR